MASERQIKTLEKIVRLAHEVLDAARTDKSTLSEKPKRIRRAGKELAAFRKMLKAERKKGTPVAALAKRHGISTAYIYSLD